MDRKALWPAAQAVKVETRLAKRVERGRRVDRVKPDQRALLQVGPNPSGFACLEQLLQTPVSETSDHGLCKLLRCGS
jgi:hypothetical protein